MGLLISFKLYKSLLFQSFEDILKTKTGVTNISRIYEDRPSLSTQHETLDAPTWWAPPQEDIPLSFSWREDGYVTEARDQGECACCWAFAGLVPIEYALKRASGVLTALSEQVNMAKCPQNAHVSQNEYTGDFGLYGGGM